MWSKYNCVILGPEISLVHGRKTAAQEHPWSTMVRMESWWLDSGRLMMRSMAICWKGNTAGSVRILYIGGQVRWVMILFCCHIVHPWTYSEIHARMSGHQ